jgi:hypothetical protein
VLTPKKSLRLDLGARTGGLLKREVGRQDLGARTVEALRRRLLEEGDTLPGLRSSFLAIREDEQPRGRAFGRRRLQGPIRSCMCGG